MSEDEKDADQRNDSKRAESPDFQKAVNKLEKAVEDLVVSAKGEISERATAFVEDAAERLQRDADSRNREGARHSDRADRNRRRKRRSRHRRPQGHYDRIPRRTGRLYRDTRREKITGVCAGIANYFGMEAWVVRCAALTGLIFMPQIVFPAYWVAYFLMDKQPTDEQSESMRKRKRKRDQHNHTSPAPELGSRLSPRRSLRTVEVDLNAIELKLRRMESHVTSGKYELQRELHKIEKAD